MKKKHIILCCLVLFFGSCTSPNQQQKQANHLEDQSQDTLFLQKKIRTQEGAQLFDNYNPITKEFSTIPFDEEVTAINLDTLSGNVTNAGLWYKVKWKGLTGWVHGYYLTDVEAKKQPAIKNDEVRETIEESILEFSVPSLKDSSKITSFDSLYNTIEVQPEFSYYQEGDERLSYIHDLISNCSDGDTLNIPEGEYISQFFVLRDRHSLTIRAKPGTVWLISDNELSTIFYMQECSNIKFEGIGFMHRTAGHCVGNSLEIHKCRNIVLDKCDISGSGTIGVVARFVDSLVLTNSYIHHCTYEMMNLRYVRDFVIFNTLFQSNKESNTSLEGISMGHIWGKGVLQNNTFCNNKSAVLLFMLKDRFMDDPITSDGHIFVRRNLFYNNTNLDKELIIQGVASSQDHIHIKENLYDSLAITNLEYDDLESRPEESVRINLNLPYNMVQKVNEGDYRYHTNEMVIGIFSSSLPWDVISQSPSD